MQKDNYNNITVRIGTRSSPLAVWQAKAISKRIKKNTKIIKISTSGDKILYGHLSNHGGKGLFTKELDEALKQNKIDIAVHSLKDVPTFIPKIFELYYILPRETSFDALISNTNTRNIKNIKQDFLIGTSSPRRISQIKHINPHINIIPIRGNIGTRIKKVKEGKISAIIIALAGIKRLKIKEKYTILSVKDFMPAVGQGIIVVQALKDNLKINKILLNLTNNEVQYQAEAERSVLKILNGDCNSAISALTRISKNELALKARVISSDGKFMLESAYKSHINQSLKIGENVGKQLLKKGALKILKI